MMLMAIAVLAGPAVAIQAGEPAGGTLPAHALCAAIRSDDRVAFRDALTRFWQDHRRRSSEAMTDQELVTRLQCEGSNLLEYARAQRAATVLEFLVAGNLDPQFVEAVLRKEGQQVSSTP